MERWGEHLEELAREVLPESVHRYVRQGARDGVTAAEAVAAWDRFRFVPAVLRDVTEVDCSTELLGTPVGLDVHAGDVQLGGTAAVGATLDVTAPTIHALDPSLPAPEVTIRVIRVTAAGPTTVAETTDPHVAVSMDQAGAYRVEILMRPLHLHDYLGRIADKGYAERVLPWIYASPIYAQ